MIPGDPHEIEELESEQKMSTTPRGNPVVAKAWNRVFRGKTAPSGVWVDKELSESQPLYRYIKWKPFGRQMFEQKKLFFCAPYEWTDPYEKWWCEQLFVGGSKLAKVNAYGWCSTSSWGDEPYWRMYDHSGTVPVIRLTTSAQRLVAILSRYVDARQAKAYIGKVTYHAAAELKSEAERLRALDESEQVSRNVAHALMLKRNAFRFEAEHRVTIIERGDKQDHRFVEFEPEELFTKVMLAPSMSQENEGRIRRYLAKHGFGGDKVRRSSLYNPV